MAPRKHATSHARAGEPYTPSPKTLAEQEAFLAAYAAEGVITAAAALAKIDRKRHYEWLDDSEKYPDYEGRFKEAHEKACDRLEKEAVRRAVEGWEEPVYGSGGPGVGSVQVGAVRKYSDRMLEIMLKARRPERFRERHDFTSAGEKMGVGVLVVPGIAAGEDWAAKAAAQQKDLEDHARDAGDATG